MATVIYDEITISVGDWIVYFRMSDNHVTSVACDIKVADKIKLEAYPEFTCLSIPITDDTGGLAVGEESARLDNIEETFEDILSRPPSLLNRWLRRESANKFVYVGRVTAACLRKYYFYSQGAIHKQYFGQLAERFPKCEFKVTSASDKEWTVYRNTLHPGNALQSLLLSWAQLDLRTKNGDEVVESRDVNHTLFFKNESSRDDFLEYIKNDGWRVDILPKRTGEGIPFRYEVCLTKNQRLDRMWSDIYIIALVSRANRFGGVYDGWGATEVHNSTEPQTTA